MKKIPDLRGLEVEDAKELLRKKSIKFAEETKKTFSLTVGNGKIVKAEEEDKKLVLYESNRKFFLFILIGVMTVTVTLALSITYGTGIFNSVKEQIIEITGIITAPELETEPGWGKERVVKVIKDAKSSKEIKFYEYCVRKNGSDECEWKETYTKNAIISKTGTWQVIFRGVDISGKRGRESTILVYVDNEAPEIKEFKIEKEEETSIKVKAKVQDKDSGIDKIMYSLDGINYKEGKDDYTFNNLVAGVEYTLYLKVVDYVGNEKVSTIRIVKKQLEEKQLEEKPLEEEKEWDTPEIDLKKLPSVFEVLEKYDLPSRFNFGNDEGKVVCKVDEDVYLDTSTLPVGRHKVECIATSNHGKETKVDKEILIQPKIGEDETIDGWIKLNLYYPEDSYNWQWRYGIAESETEEYEELGWEDYIGPILIRIEDINKIYIRYDQDGESKIKAPTDQVLVDIEPSENPVECGKDTQVKINFDQLAKTKEYRIDGGKWQNYEGPFPVNGNTLIEARATKDEGIYSSEGELEFTKLLEGYDKRVIKESACAKVIDTALNLNSIPKIVYLGESKSLPSYYTYGTHGEGTVECTDQNGDSVINTKYLKEGNYKVTCSLTAEDGTKQGPISRNFTVERREQEPEISMWNVPSKIVKDDSYKLPSYYTYGTHGEGNIVCQDELSNVITNTSELELGQHIVTCTLTAEDGQVKTDTRSIDVAIGFEPYIDLNNVPATIYKGSFYSLPSHYGYGRPNTGIKECKVDGIELTDTHSLNVGSHTIKCEIQNLAGQKDSVEKQINVIERPLAPAKLVGPVIEINPTSLSETTTITITPQEEASIIKYTFNGYSWYTYNGPITVHSNGRIYAYYIRKSDGKKSQTTRSYINNIRKANKPYVRIDVQPIEVTGNEDSFEVRITGVDADYIEYSFDNVVFTRYTGPFTIINTSTTTIYARGVDNNGYGPTESYEIVTKKPPIIPEQLNVSIGVTPDGTQDYLVNEALVTVSYDTKATEKYYKIGEGEWQEYKEPFKVNENTTVYAYAKSETGRSQIKQYKIDYLRLGISNPEIIADKVLPLRAHSVKVHINWDKDATEKKYRIIKEDETVSEWIDWVDDIEIDENCQIEAYQKDNLDYESEKVKLEINNIVPMPQFIPVEKDDYYLIKLNYPSTSSIDSRDYKWKQDGTWKRYDDRGILLIKQDKKDKYDLTKDGLEVTDDNNEKVNIPIANVYILDIPLSEMSENLFMRWDNTKPEAPTMITNTESDTKEVLVSIRYPKVLVEKYYKLVTADGEETDWMPYTKVLTINKNNTTIYAKGKNRLEIESEIASKTITNIDEIAPEIEVTGDLETPKQAVNLTVNASDNRMLYMIKYAKGVQTKDYFNENQEDQGNTLKNGSTIQIEENGKYTFYAVDQVGNETLKEVEITNVDKEAPNLSVNVLTPGVTSQARISIDYGDSVTKMYSIGDNSNYKAYTDEITLSSYDYIDKANQDGSLTIYVRGKDEAGNITEISEDLRCLDLDMPNKPSITAAADYPVLTENGVESRSILAVVYDQRNDIINEISQDGGETWTVYTGNEKLISSIVKARSRKITSGLTASNEITVEMPSDTLRPEAYDGDFDSHTSNGNTNILNQYINIDSSVKGNNIDIKYGASSTSYSWSYQVWIYIELEDGTQETIVNGVRSLDETITYTIPNNAKRLLLKTGKSAWISEVYTNTMPIVSSEKVYPLLTYDGMQNGYSKVSLKYYSTAVRRLYQIVEPGETLSDEKWQDYDDTIIRLELGQNLYAKSIDKNGVSSLVCSYLSELEADALPSQSYDGDTTTGYEIPESDRSSNPNRYIDVDQSMIGKEVKIIAYGLWQWYRKIIFIDADGNSLLTHTLKNNETIVYIIPKNTARIKFCDYGTLVYEIYPNDEPTIDILYQYPILNNQKITSQSAIVSIEYLKSSLSKYYKIDNGDWQEYTGSFEANEGQVIYAKAVDKNGNESLIRSETVALPIDMLNITAVDGNNSTEQVVAATKNVIFNAELDSEPLDLMIRSNASTGSNIKLYDANGTLIDTTELDDVNKKITLPINTKKVEITAGSSDLNISEIYFSDESINIDGDSILSILDNNNLIEGYYTFRVNGEEYPVHIVEIDTDTISKNTYFGDYKDVGSKNSTAERMVIALRKGNLTIDEDIEVGPYFDEKYGGPKGFFLYVTGKLTNNGTIDNSHGAYAEGQDVYLWKNPDDTYEYVPAVGGAGGADRSTSNSKVTAGNSGEAGNTIEQIGTTNRRATGGGGSGAAYQTSGVYPGVGKAGSAGTSYSGGTGGGASTGNTATIGAAYGAAGGTGGKRDGEAGGGAGNPGGTGSKVEFNGSNGTGGLLIIYANEYKNNGNITATGSDGGAPTNKVSGGSSGGGSINIFTNQSTEINQINQVGILTNTMYDAILGITDQAGGASVSNGGTGTINIGEIRNGTYYDLKEIIEQDKLAYLDSVSITGDSLISILQENTSLTTGYYNFKVTGNNGTNTTIENYPVHLYVLEGDQIITTNTVYGDSEDISDGTNYAKNMVIVKVNGDYTVNEGVTVGPYFNENGGPKGFFLYVTGKLTNNGTIDNSHGAIAAGQDVYLYKNGDNSYEYVPAVGGIAPDGTTSGGNRGIDGSNGQSGTNRGTGSGGGGANVYSSFYSSTTLGGKASDGTSYSGGAGGGGGNHKWGEDNGNANAQTGGSCYGINTGNYCQTGVGIKTGVVAGSGWVQTNLGTGGLLIIYTDTFENNGTISANGTAPAPTTNTYVAYGGASGGGSVNIFYTNSIVNTGTVTAAGGVGLTNGYGNGNAREAKSGSGGDGTVTYTQINPLSPAELHQAQNVLSANTISETISRNANIPEISQENTENGRMITIEVENDNKTEYSLDLGNTWLEYTEPFEVLENTTIFTRVVDNDNNVLGSSTYTITTIEKKIEKQEEDNILPPESTPNIVEDSQKEEENPKGSDVDE